MAGEKEAVIIKVSSRKNLKDGSKNAFRVFKKAQTGKTWFNKRSKPGNTYVAKKTSIQG